MGGEVSGLVQGPPQQQALVLVVDDDVRIHKALRRDLERLGYRVIHAMSGLEGLGVVGQAHPDVILTDLRMPGIDGHTFLRRLRGHGCGAGVAVTSGNGDVDDLIEVLRGGAVDYLKKPWSDLDLYAAMRRALDSARSMRGRPPLARAEEAPWCRKPSRSVTQVSWVPSSCR